MKNQDQRQQLGNYLFSPDILNSLLEFYGLDFVIRGHQDNYANNVLFMYDDDTNTPNGIDVDKLICMEQNINIKKTKEQTKEIIPSKLQSINEFKINPVARLELKYNDNGSQSILHTNINSEKSKLLINNNNSVQAMTITTNTDLRRYFTKDSFIILSYNEI